MHLHRIVAGIDRVGRRDLELHILALSRIHRNGSGLLRSIGFGERRIEISRRLGRKADQQFFAAVVLDRQRVLEIRVR